MMMQEINIYKLAEKVAETAYNAGSQKTYNYLSEDDKELCIEEAYFWTKIVIEELGDD